MWNFDYHEERNNGICQLNKKWLTLVDALDDIIDMWGCGRNMFGFPVHNSYVPMRRHTIMLKLNLTDNDEPGFGFT